jgi:hypothetical protein
MAYWWVSQNQTYREERRGGFLWAPNRDEAGRTPFHWATMNDVRPGDFVFSYVGGRIVSVSVARAAAYDSPRPSDLVEGLWEDEGKRIDVEYRDVLPGLPIAGLLAEIQPLLPERYSPLNRNGTGNQGYLFSAPPRAGRLVLDRIGVEQSDALNETVSDSVTETTERRSLVLSRIGQGEFRESLMSLWGGRCAVTGLDVSILLRASHIKPWRDSDNRERLDPYNGLLLAPSCDAAFDSGLITFGDEGRVMLGDQLTPSRISAIGISPVGQIVGLHDRHRNYLAYHRQNVFVG